jgi:hypothetical protein
MEIKYNVETMIIRNGRIYAYKVYAGAYIFYLSQKVFSEAANSGLIEFDGTAKSVKFNDIIRHKGEEAVERLKYAVANTTLDYLIEELEVVNEMPPLLYLHLSFGTFRLAAISLMVKSCTVEMQLGGINRDSENANKRVAELNKVVAEGYSGVLNYIANYCDKEYCNSHNLIRMVKENNRENYRLFGDYNIKLGY